MPTIRCLTKAQAAAYLGIGVTLFESLGVGAIKFGRRTVYDRLDLDEWLDKYKSQSRGGMEVPNNGAFKHTHPAAADIRGLSPYSQTAKAYAKAIGLKPAKKSKR